LCPGQPAGDYCDCTEDCANNPGFCACPAAEQCCGGGGGGGGCLDGYASRLGVTALPSTASTDYKKLYCQYTKIDTPKGPIEIFGQTELSSLQLYRARKIMGFYLENIDCDECFGADKSAVANIMAVNKAKLDMPNGAHEQPGAGQSLQGQELFYAETPVEGDKWFMENNMDHRDAAFEEILHLVHDFGIGIDVPGYGYKKGALPEYQVKIRAATTHNQPTWLNPPGNGFWAEREKDWIKEIEGSLTQEYIASVVDVYYGLWANYGRGMWGIYGASTRSQMKTSDRMGYDLMPQFFNPKLTWMVMLSPSLDQTFSMTFDRSKGYTWKSQYYQHATLLGSNDVDLQGNADDNCLGPNQGTNSIDGKSGSDTCMFQGKCNEYSISCSGGSCSITDFVTNRDGVTHTSNIDALTFVDGDYDIAADSCTVTLSGTSMKCWLLVDTPTSAPTPADCEGIGSKQECIRSESCSWRRKSCSKALTTRRCKVWNRKKKKCKRNGCVWKNKKKKCKGRWPWKKQIFTN